jgi:hypothetical protein
MAYMSFLCSIRQEKSIRGGRERGKRFRRRKRGAGLHAAVNLSGTLAGVVYSNDESRRPGGANWRVTRGESERRGRAICRRGGSPVKAGIEEGRE